MSNRENEGRRADSVSRRDFLQTSALTASALGLSLSAARTDAVREDINCILLFLVGGPSQLDTFDPKPDAPAEVRGPFRPIQTNVSGVQVSELFPRMATRADRFAIVRSVHHDDAPIHETGQQLLQTGRLSRGEVDHPHIGAVLSQLRGPRSADVPPFILLPGPMGSTGVSVSHGQGAGYLGPRHAPFWPDSAQPSDRLRSALDAGNAERYGPSAFGRSCLQARRLVEAGVRMVTVNMFDTVFNAPSWDCHADGGSLATNLDDYRRLVCPMFDQAYSALLDDLSEHGMLETTLVLAAGEFGRTPRLNARGGRDHWPGVWSVLFAGGGVQGGQVIGASDRLGAEPRNRPVSPAEIAATVYHVLGVPGDATLPGPEGTPVPVTEGRPIAELFRG
jgi:uncharacterized protein (DUF1501 family)